MGEVVILITVMVVVVIVLWLWVVVFLVGGDGCVHSGHCCRDTS